MRDGRRRGDDLPQLPRAGGRRDGQTRDRQIDCLADVGAALGNDGQRLWRMQNGYAMFGEAGLAQVDRRLAALDAAGREALKGLLRIGAHWNADVTDLAHERVPGPRVFIVSFAAPDEMLKKLVA